MDADLVFTLANGLVMPFWLLLAVAPRWVWTQRLVHMPVVPLLFAALYLLALASVGDAPEGAGFGSLEGVMLLFGDPFGALAGWIHYLVFDLFVGAWEARDAARRGIAHWLVLPCLLLTLMLGPVGLALYLVIRAAAGRGFSLEEHVARA